MSVARSHRNTRLRCSPAWAVAPAYEDGDATLPPATVSVTKGEGLFDILIPSDATFKNYTTLFDGGLDGPFLKPLINSIGIALIATLIAIVLASFCAYAIARLQFPGKTLIFGTGEVIARYPDAPPVPRTILLNPELEPLGAEEDEDWEGCLSVPGMRGMVPRYRRLRYRGRAPYGTAIARTVEGFHARVVQHECDHLIGRLYPTRMRDLTRFGYTSVLFPELDPTADD